MALSFCASRAKYLTSNILHKASKRYTSGYFVLVPELGEDLPDKDPLMKEDGLPEFNAFTVEKLMAAVGKQTVLYEQEIRNVEETAKTSDHLDVINDVIDRLESSDVRLHTIWGISNTLYFGNQSLMPNRYHQTIHSRMTKARSLKYMSAVLHDVWKEALENPDPDWTPEQLYIISKNYREGRLNGLELSDSALTRFMFDLKAINQKKDNFRRMLGIATIIFKMNITNANVVKDFPEEFLKEIAKDPNNWKNGPWTITLEPPIVQTFLEFCPDREMRWNVWQANVGRCSMLGENSLRTSPELEEIRHNKREQAQLVGYKSYAHMSMETKMAENLESIYRVMGSLLKVAYPAQVKELDELTVFAHDRGFDGRLYQWDIPYWSRKYMRSIYNMKSEVLQEYFPLPHVLNGLFQLIEYLFDVRIVEGPKTDVWHTDVRFFDVFDLRQSTTEPIAHLYLDAYSRGRNKLRMSQSLSWTVPIQSRSKLMNKKPLVAMIFNFSPPKGEVPSLLSFDDVNNLFRLSGQALQNLLTTVEYSDVAGLSNVEWDAVGLSDNMMVNWLYEPEILSNISRHYKTQEPISPDLIEGIRQSKTHMAGYKLCEELYYSKLDMKLFETSEFWNTVVDKLWKEHFCMKRDREESQVTNWHEVFVENYAAAYYCSLWSKMLGTDAFEAFTEVVDRDPDEIKKIGARFRDNFLASGGSIPTRELYRRFRGRDPNAMAYLRSLGFDVDLSATENL